MTASTNLAIKLTFDGKEVDAGLAINRKNLNEFASELRGASGSGDLLASSIKRVAHYGSAAFAVTKIAEFSKSMVDAQVQADRLRQQMGTVFGGGNIGRETTYLVSISNKLGLSLAETANSYAKLSAASKGTALEGAETRKIFEAVGNAAAKMGLSTAEADGALNALQQMISKGTVSAEELRGQLGERLPGAFQMAARAMGVTTAELGKMLELGQIAATDLLPKLADEMNKTFGAGSSIDTAQATLNRLSTAWTQFKTSLTDAGAASPALALLDTFTQRLNAAAEAMQEAKRQGYGGGAQMLIGAGAGVFMDNKAQRFARQKDLTDQINSFKRKAERNDGYLSPIDRQFVANLEGELAELRRLAVEFGKVEIPNLRDIVDRDRQEATGALEKFKNDRKTSAQKMAAEIAAENAAFNALRNKDAEAEAAHRAKLLEIQNKYGKDAAKAAKEKADAFKEALNAAQSFAADMERDAEGQGRDVERLKEEAIQIQGGAEALARYRAEKLDAAAAGQDLNATIYDNAAAFARESKASEEAIRVYERLAEAARESATALRDQAKLTVSNESAKEAKKDYEETEKAAAKAAEKAAADSAREWEKFADDIERGLTDALFRAFESGKGFGESFVDTLQNTLKSTVLKIVVQAIVDPITGGLKGALGLGSGDAESTGGVGGGLGSVMSIGSTLSTLKNLWTNASAITQGTYAAQQFATLANSDLGVKLGLSNAVDIGENGKLVYELTSTGGSIDKLFNSSTFQTAAAGFAGAALGNAIAGEYRLSSKISGAQVGALLGSIAGPMGAFIGGTLGGVVDRAFGRGPKKVKDFGIQGTFSGTGFEGSTYEFWKQKGGWFRSGKKGTNYGSMNAELDAYLDSAFAAMKLKTALFAQTLGQSADAIAAYSQTITLSLKGKDATQAINDMLAGIGDNMANLVLAGTNYAKEGERASATLERLASSFVRVNDWLGRLNQTLLKASLASGDAASQLLDLFGGLEKFNAAEGQFFDLYYDQTEKIASIQTAISQAFTGLGLKVPATKREFRELVASLDLMTDSGRSAYATLVTLAPTFSETVAALEEAGRAMAEQLLRTYTADGALIPALSAIADASGAAARDVTQAAGIISAIFLDAESGLLDFGATVTAIAGDSGALSLAQGQVSALSDEIFALAERSKRTSLNFAGLATALATADIPTFVATIGGALQKIAERFADVLGNIANERIAVRGAAAKILNPGVLSPEAIRAGIAGAAVSAPSKNALTAAGAELTARINRLNNQNAYIAQLSAQISGLGYQQTDNATRYAQIESTLGGYQGEIGKAQQTIAYINSKGSRFKKYGSHLPFWQEHLRANQAAYDGALAAMQALLTDNAGLAQQMAALGNDRSAAQAQADRYAEQVQQQTEVAKQAQLAYAASLQQFVKDAGKSVNTLSRLREETVRWYDEQKRLADMMRSAAGNLRGTVEQIRFGQLSEQDKFATLDKEFNIAYAMALSTTGETLAGYGDKLNNLLAPALDAAQGALSPERFDAYMKTALARAEAIATRLDTLAPSSYEQTSLDLLGGIDAALASLEAAGIVANDSVVAAINASKDQTVQGLRAVVAALTGQAVPAFASGGYHAGGLRLVGENGPELEVTGPARIFDASTTRQMLTSQKVGASETALLARIDALVAEVAAMRAETRATAIATSGTERRLKRIEEGGMTVRTESDEPLHTVVA